MCISISNKSIGILNISSVTIFFKFKKYKLLFANIISISVKWGDNVSGSSIELLLNLKNLYERKL